MIEKICQAEQYNYCYFRTVSDAFPKTLIQITTKCNMFCQHCFLSASDTGTNMSLSDFKTHVINFLQKNNIKKITLTGGEPLTHPNIYEICNELYEKDIAVTICTNIYKPKQLLLEQLCELNNVKFNVSIDGFSSKSVNSFRNRPDAFQNIINNVNFIASRNKLKGVLCTPNVYSNIDEYCALTKFANESRADYILFNPIASLGRGALNIDKDGVSMNELVKLRNVLERMASKSFDVCFIRFPDNRRTTSICKPSRFIYILSNGIITKCPYILFAYQTLGKKIDQDIVLGNIFAENIYMSDLESEQYEKCKAHDLMGE